VLASGSSVFYAMLYGGLSGADASKDVIPVPDVEPVAFLTMLKYLYCDEINLTPDNVLATLYCAKKYIVPHLVSFFPTSSSSPFSNSPFLVH
jgi:BTB/POZ domain-containing protein 3/6